MTEAQRKYRNSPQYRERAKQSARNYIEQHRDDPNRSEMRRMAKEIYQVQGYIRRHMVRVAELRERLVRLKSRREQLRWEWRAKRG